MALDQQGEVQSAKPERGQSQMREKFPLRRAHSVSVFILLPRPAEERAAARAFQGQLRFHLGEEAEDAQFTKKGARSARRNGRSV
jgi:hypothetical protein